MIYMLGVTLYSDLTWNKHINHISMKIARFNGILYRLRNVYPESVFVTIYNTLMLPHFHYCRLLWWFVVKENHSRSASAPKESSKNNYQ